MLEKKAINDETKVGSARSSDRASAFGRGRRTASVRKINRPLGASATAIDDPIGAVTRFSWAVTRQVTGVSAGALVTYMPARTVLFMSADASPYRG